METGDNLSKRTEFFISYNGADEKWAEWIATVLETEGFTTTIQAWDFVPGSNFVLEMNRAAAESNRTLAVVSPDYLDKSKFGNSEWAAAFAKDPEGFRRHLVPVRVRECQIEGLLKQIVYIDLVGKTESESRLALLNGVRGKRSKPTKSPAFPGSNESPHVAQAPIFPGSLKPGVGPPVPQHIHRYIPEIRRPPSDLEKRRFVQNAFKTVAQHFEQAGNQLAAQEGVNFDFQPASATQFTAEIFVDGNSKRRCKIWIYSDGIAFYEGSFGWRGDDSFNEMLSLVQNELALSALMEMDWGDEGKGLNLKQLTPEDAAEYLWRRFVSHLN
jgi:hypothetical protein